MFFSLKSCILNLYLSNSGGFFMKKIFSILLSTLLCVSVIAFSPLIQYYADSNNPSDIDPSIPTPCVDEGSDDDF